MKQTQIRQVTLLSLLIALSVVLGYFVKVPTPTGMLTLLDAGIFFTAFTLGKKEAMIVGGVAGFLIDFLSGYPQWMLISLLAHGLQGYFAGWRGHKRLLGVLLACLAMVGIYFIASVFFYNIGSALAEVFGNIGQTVFGAVVGAIATQAYKRIAH